MIRKNMDLPEDLQVRRVEILNRCLADAIDLQLQSRQAYWNIKGPHLLSLRELFDRIVEDAEKYANQIAERIVQVGGKAEGTARAVAGRSSLSRPLLASADYSEALLKTITDFGRYTRSASAQAIELRDVDTAEIFTGIARGIKKWVWLVEMSQQSAT